MRFKYLILITCLTFSCVNYNSWEQVQTVKDLEWNVSTKYSFVYPSTDTSGIFDIYIDVRHSAQYKYSNLYLFVSTKAPNGQSIKDTLEFKLANTKGQWYGSGLSDMKEVRLKYKSGIKFGQSGKFTFEIEQAMRDQVLKHISDVGLRIVKN